MRSEPVRFSDEGASLLEVLVSLAVISVAMAGLGSFFVTGNLVVAQSRDERQAVQVAADGIEQVRGLEGSALLHGRGPVKVKEQWDAALTGPYRQKMKPYLDSMQMASDPEIKDSTSMVGEQAPLSTGPQTLTVGNAVFKRSIFVGKCEVYVLRTDDCVDPTTVTPPTNSAEILRYFRVVVLITWDGKNCADGKCSHIASTLISEAAEPVFDSNPGIPELVTTDLAFYVGREKTLRLDVNGGRLPYTWTVTPRPAWLTAPTTTGYITANPTTVGVTDVKVRVTDGNSIWDEGTVKLTVVQPPSLTLPVSSKSHVDDEVTLTPVTAGGIGKLTYRLMTALPADMSMDSKTGVITGRFPQAGPYDIKILVEDVNGETDTKTFRHTVYSPLSMTAPAAQTVSLGSPVAATATAAGGDALYKYSLTGAPLGVVIDTATGVISGTPTVPGRYLPTVTVADGVGGTVSTTFQLVVTTTTKLTFSSPNPSAADQTSPAGTATSLALATNAEILVLKNVSYTVTGLPPGLTFNPGKATIAGTPTAKGNYPVKIVAQSNLPTPQSAEMNLVWTIT